MKKTNNCIKSLLIYVFLAHVNILYAQETFTLKGKVYDFKTRTELPGATIQLMQADSTIISTTTAISHWQDGNRTGETSDFILTVPKQDGKYIIRCSFIGYKTTDMTVTLDNLKKREFLRELPPILMRENSKTLNEVTVSATKVQFYYHGDTIVYNADAFVLAERYCVNLHHFENNKI